MTASLFAPLGLEDLLHRLASGQITPEASIRRTMERIEAVDGALSAFVRVAPPQSVREALDARGPLAGVPLGVKDTFDTADMATEQGSSIHAGHRPRADAALVAMARAGGAFIAGKTATAEFAGMTPPATRNPHDPGHTPGGSSSGSAAAVAAGLVAGAFGSQTAGSVIRPAAYCGIAGFKPSFRLLPTVGMKTFAWSLDTAGLFARGVADVARLAALITRRDLAVDPTFEAGRLRVGIYRSAVDAVLDPAMLAALEQAARRMEAAGATLFDVTEPATLTAARQAQAVIQDFEGAVALGHERLTARAAISPALLAALDRGAAISPEIYDEARRLARAGRRESTRLFETVDVLLAPSAPSAAPASLVTTGDPVMNRLWTLTGNPCVNVPGLLDDQGLPLGVCIVARFGRDRLALAAGALLESRLRG